MKKKEESKEEGIIRHKGKKKEKKKERKKRDVWHHGQAAHQNRPCGAKTRKIKNFGVHRTPQFARGDSYGPWWSP